MPATTSQGDGDTDGLIDKVMAPIKHLALAKSQPEVQELARRAQLDLRGFNWPLIHDWNDERRFPGLSPVISRLVQTGLDTPENLQLLFGSAESVADIQREMRMYCLLSPPPGSPAFAMGYRGPAPSDPDQPADPAVIEALPRWQRELAEGEQPPDCSICSEKLASPAQALPGCSHLYHPVCIRRWLQRKSTCPLCRTPVPDMAPRPPSAEELEAVARVREMQQLFRDMGPEEEEEEEEAALQQQPDGRHGGGRAGGRGGPRRGRRGGRGRGRGGGGRGH
ncbi:hypothetical protein ABPG75_003072 [Micractinium tetrahymenae]